MTNHLDIFICPACGGDLEITASRIECLNCHNSFKVENDIPLLFWPNEWDSSKKDCTDVIKAFYEETPFPNYDDFENVGDLLQKARKGLFAQLLNEQIPFNVRVLEVGCGTGQVSNFLGVAHRIVFGADICLNSLKLGEEFRRKGGLERVGFYQMNLFRPIFRPASFALVICNGVLHSTSDPFAGFQSISRLVRKGGYIIIGLYDKYGRLATDIRRLIFKLSHDHFKFLDPQLRKKESSDAKKRAWFMDQYKNPQESKHTPEEVLEWFDRTDFDFVNSIPKLKAFETFSKSEKLFKPNPRGNWFDHFIVNVKSLLKGSKEGGFFVMIGKRKL